MSTQASNDTATRMSSDAAVPFRLEVVVIPVADVDRAKDFYVGLGWRFDGEIARDDGYRLIQLTPPDRTARSSSATASPPPSRARSTGCSWRWTTSRPPATNSSRAASR
jgi:catechol 2,3-dioxygenase-like lactoylglutathione lyase family enzyme